MLTKIHEICTEPNASGYGGDCPEGIPVEFGLLAILAAFGVAFGVLYTALTIQLGGRRKKRSGDDWEEDASCLTADATFHGFYGCHFSNFLREKEGSPWHRLADILWHGKHSALSTTYITIRGGCDKDVKM